MIPQTKHVIIVVLFIVTILGGLLFARFAEGGFAMSHMQDQAAVLINTVSDEEPEVAPTENVATRRAVARDALVDKLQEGK